MLWKLRAAIGLCSRAMREPGGPAEAMSTPRLAALVGAATVLCFLPSLWAGFVYDDVMLIADNPYAQSLRYVGRAFTTHFWNTYDQGSQGIGLHYYRPLVTLSFILNWVVSGGRAWAFHLVNVLLHAATVSLALVLAVGWVRMRWAAVVAAVIFAVHPTRTESVVWIAGRTDVMMALFCLLCVLCARRAARSRTSTVPWTVAFGVSAVAAFLCKESSALLPLLVAVELAAAPRGSPRRHVLGRMLGLSALLTLVYLAARIGFAPVREGALDFTPRYALVTVASYAERIVFPWPQTFFFRPLVASHGEFQYPLGWVVTGGAVVAAYLALVVRALRRDFPAALLLIAAVGFLGPVLNIWYTGIFVTSSDHFLYLPLWLFVTGVLRLAGDRLSGLARRSLAILFGGIVLVSVAVDTIRTLDYRSDWTLWRHELELNPHNPFVLRSVGRLFAEQGDVDVGLQYLIRSLDEQATRQALLGGSTDSFRAYVQAIQLQAARLPDGARHDLEVAYRELDALFRRQPGTVSGTVGPLNVGRPVRGDVIEQAQQGKGIALMAADAGVLAARVGADGRARVLLGRIGEDAIRRLPNPLNVVLAEARLCAFEQARSWLTMIAGQPAGSRRPSDDAVSALRGRIDRAEALVRRARAAGEPEATMLRAQAMGELGAYLRGLWTLRPVYEAHRSSPKVVVVYVQLLVAARLVDRAREAAQAGLGAEAGRALVAVTESKLPPRLRSLAPIDEVWWPPPEHFRVCR